MKKSIKLILSSFVMLSTFFLFLCITTETADAKVKVFEKIKDKVETTGGWDRYIYAWGDVFIPDPDRWVAIRSSMKNGKRDMGNFWDIRGSGKEVYGSKSLILWDLKYKFQKSLEPDRKYRFIPVWEKTHKDDDYGYYYILCGTGYFVNAANSKKTPLKVNFKNKNNTYPKTSSYMWKIENVGKNRFIFINRSSKLVVDAEGGKGSKKGTKLHMWSRHGKANQQWEFILIAKGKEVKSTKKLIKKRASEIGKTTKNLTEKGYHEVEKLFNKTILKGIDNAVQQLTKRLITLKHDRNNKTLLLKVGADTQLDKLLELKEKAMSKFVRIELKKFKFEPDGLDKFRLSLINSVGAMGKNINLTLSVRMKWALDQKGFRISNFTMDRFSIPFFPDKTTKGIRSSINKSLKKLNVNLQRFPGKKHLAEAVKTSQNSSIKVVDVDKGKTKFVVKMKY